MGCRSWFAGLAIVAHAVFIVVPVAVADDSQPKSAVTSDEKLSLTRQAIKWSKERLSELDATIAVLEQNAAKLQADGRSQAEAGLKKLRERRDAYFAEVEEANSNVKTWTDTQVAEAQKSLDETSAAFESERDRYLDSIKADITMRRAALKAELDARLKAWQVSIDELRAEAGKVSDERKADIEARIASLKKQADEEKARVGRLQNASSDSWKTMKRSFADAQKLFSDTYASVRKSIEDAIDEKQPDGNNGQTEGTQ